MTINNIIEKISYNPTNPDNIRLYHGTTSIGKQNILHNGGFKNIEQTIWNCSEYDMVYFYELNRFAKSEGREDESLGMLQYAILQRANENAQIQEAILNSPNTHTYVLEFVLPPEANQFIEEDDSCDNMKDYGAVQINTAIINYFIKTGNCTINVYRYDFYPKMAYFYIAGLKNNEFTQTYFDELSKEEMYAIEAIAEADTCEIFERIVLEVEPTFENFVGSLDINYYR